MKALTKKSLALLLSVAMVLSVCSVGVFAEGTDPIAVTSVTLDKSELSLEIGRSETLNATVDPEGATITWSSSDETVATVSNSGVVTAKKVGNATITATAGEQTDTCAVTVEKRVITGVTAPEVKVPLGLVGNKLSGYFPASFEVTLSGGGTKTLKVGDDLMLSVEGVNTGAAGTYPCSASLKDTETYTLADGVNFDFNIKVVTSWKLDDISITAVTDGDGDSVYINLGTKVYNAIEELLGEDPDDRIYFDFEDITYGDVDRYGDDYTVALEEEDEEDLDEDGELADSFTYETTVDGVKYSGSVKLTLCTTDVSASFTYAGGTLSSVASRIDALLGGDMEAIEFDDIELDGGTLWEDDDYETEVDEGVYYTLSELGKMIYLPNGSGDTSYLSYIAYDDYDSDDDEVDDNADYVEGVIYLYADSFMLLSANITSDDVVELDGATFEDAFLELDSDYEYLDYVTFTKPSSDDGYLYYEYEEDEKNTSISSSTKYYVEHDDKALIDDITYVPGKETEGVVNIKFKAIGYDDDEKKVTVTGFMQITVTVPADITINAGKGQTVEIDPDLFLEFIEDYDTTNKELEIVSVAITGAPYQAKKGYLVTDGDELTKSGVKTFYADEDDVDIKNKKYDLFDLSFQGGTADNTVEATFKVCYLREGSTTKRYAPGTIDFVTGANAASNVMTATIKAAEPEWFGKQVTMDSFKVLGGNDNEYFVFTSLPVGGKLVYNWGKAGQEDVKVGTEYYLTYKAGKKLMQNVTFVPSYSSVKTEKTITMDIKGFNAKGKTVTGSINITVKCAAYSSKFYDITTSTYADSVDFLANQGITTGMTATTFGPNSNVTRAQFVTFLWRAAGSPTVTGVTNKFTDVKSTGTYAYAYQAILWAVQNGITTGTSATTFAPASNVTHQELLTFLYRYDVNYLKHPSTASSYVSYTDYSSVSSYAQVPVKWADYKGILTGYTIQPTVAGTRATVALWLHRMLTL